MKIVVAMDSFKESLTAQEACDIVADAIGSVRGDVEIVVKPMADGGEGTARAMLRACGGEWIRRTVMGPLPEMEVEAGFAWFGDERCALVEMAAASGLELLGVEQRNPLLTTTFGTGQLILAAKEYGAEKIYLAIGGSATVDGGTGAAAAIGWKFVDGEGNELSLGGGQLGGLVRTLAPDEKLSVPVEVLCDVDSPLCGDCGAARVYGPQKGANSEMVEQLEAGLANLAAIVRRDIGCEIENVAGAGAAGGLAAGAIGFMGADLTSGIEFVINQSGIEEEMAGADWLVTGEGRFDGQSLCGKVIAGLVRVAQKTVTKVAVIAGEVLLDEKQYRDGGISEAFSCMEGDMSVQYSIQNAKELLRKTAIQLAGSKL